jgi:hypothetical protein
MSELLDAIELFFGDANPAETRVYARLAGEAMKPGMRLTGSLAGPFCRYAQTLPATIPLIDLGPGASLLAQAIVPDPCFWSPELPYLYRANVELRLGSESLGTIERTLGIRPLGARGRRFYFEGKPWVLRGVRANYVSQSDLRELHNADAALYIDEPADELCAAASEEGVLIVAEAQIEPAAIRRLSRHASVGFVVSAQHSILNTQNSIHRAQSARSTTSRLEQHLRSLAPNVVFVERCDHACATPTAWAGALLCEEFDRLSEATLPVIAYRPETAAASIAQRRALCDVLQRDLAGSAEVAGYLV